MTTTAQDLLALGASTLHEVTGRRGWLGPEITERWPGCRVAGRARTVWTPPGDNLGLHLALEDARPGDVLCAATTGGWSYGYWGEVLTRAAAARGVVGVVVAGGVRDVDALRAAAFPAFGLCTAVQGTVKADPGRHQVGIVIGAAMIHPGDWIVGDADGVVVVADDRVQAAVRDGRARLAWEEAVMADVDGGTTTRTAMARDRRPPPVG